MRGIWLASILIGCNTTVECGEGTHRSDETCVPLDDDTDDTDDMDTGRSYVRVAYFVEWGVYERGYQVSDIPASQVTHINYGFIDTTAAGTWEAGVMEYWDIEQNYVTDASCTRHWHAVAAVPWIHCFDGTFITYDDAESWSAKLAFVLENGLAAAMA